MKKKKKLVSIYLDILLERGWPKKTIIYITKSLEFLRIIEDNFYRFVFIPSIWRVETKSHI